MLACLRAFVCVCVEDTAIVIYDNVSQTSTWDQAELNGTSPHLPIDCELVSIYSTHCVNVLNHWKTSNDLKCSSVADHSNHFHLLSMLSARQSIDMSSTCQTKTIGLSLSLSLSLSLIHTHTLFEYVVRFYIAIFECK